MAALALAEDADAAVLLAAVLTEEAVRACALVDVVRDVELGLGDRALLVAESVLHTRPRRAATFDLRPLLWRRWRLQGFAIAAALAGAAATSVAASAWIQG